MPGRALHISDLHVRRRRAPEIEAALTELVAEVEPELVIATGDLSHRGRRDELARAKALLDALGPPTLAVPGNHDIPYAIPGRFTRPWAEFERVFGSTDPVYRSDTLLVCGLNSVRPWRQQGGRLSARRLVHAVETLRSAPPRALRVVAFHHHLAGAPWRASRKFPLKHRDGVLGLGAAGAELVVGGHIHQGAVAEEHEFRWFAGARSSLVLATAPGLGRPRPRLKGEAQGAQVYEWDADWLAVLTYVWNGSRLEQTARREFPRNGASYRSVTWPAGDGAA